MIKYVHNEVVRLLVKLPGKASSSLQWDGVKPSHSEAKHDMYKPHRSQNIFLQNIDALDCSPQFPYGPAWIVLS